MNDGTHSNEEQLHAEIAALRAEISEIREAEKRRSERISSVSRRASRLGWLVAAGPKLDEALTIIFDRLDSGDRPSPVELASATAALIRRIIRVGLIAFVIALLPLTVAVVQTALLSKQNSIMRDEQLTAWKRDRLRAISTAEGIHFRLNEIIRVFKIEWTTKRDAQSIASLMDGEFTQSPNLTRRIEETPDLLGTYPEIYTFLHQVSLGFEYLSAPVSPWDTSNPIEDRQGNLTLEDELVNQGNRLRDIEVNIIQGVLDTAQERLDSAKSLIQAERGRLVDGVMEPAARPEKHKPNRVPVTD